MGELCMKLFFKRRRCLEKNITTRIIYSIIRKEKRYEKCANLETSRAEWVTEGKKESMTDMSHVKSHDSSHDRWRVMKKEDWQTV